MKKTYKKYAKNNDVIVFVKPELFGDIGIMTGLKSPYIDRPFVIYTCVFGGACFAKKDFKVIGTLYTIKPFERH